jgi:hypothetical protein
MENRMRVGIKDLGDLKNQVEGEFRMQALVYSIKSDRFLRI